MELIMSIRFLREDNDGSTEALTIVQLLNDCKNYYIEVCSGPDIGDDFIGLYDLEGNRIEIGNQNWEAVEFVSQEIIDYVICEWSSGLSFLSLI